MQHAPPAPLPSGLLPRYLRTAAPDHVVPGHAPAAPAEPAELGPGPDRGTAVLRGRVLAAAPPSRRRGARVALLLALGLAATLLLALR